MLRRERQIRAWVQRLLDASLFGIGLWLAHWVRKASGFQVFGGTIWMVGHSITRAPRFSKRVRKSADCEAARVMRMVLPVSSMLDDFGKDFSGSH